MGKKLISARFLIYKVKNSKSSFYLIEPSRNSCQVYYDLGEVLSAIVNRSHGPDFKGLEITFPKNVEKIIVERDEKTYNLISLSKKEISEFEKSFPNILSFRKNK